MSLVWPGLLYGFAIIPLMVLIYLWGLKRRGRYAVRMSSLSLVREAARATSAWRHHLPFGLFLIALISLLVGACRPVVALTVPAKQGIIVLALDVSRSMCSPDIQPTRLEAVEATLLKFVQAQRPTTKIGIVAFSDFADLIQPPTNDKAAIDRAIRGLMTGWERSIGDGIYQSLDVIVRAEGTNTSNDQGGYAPAIIILVTNGLNNAGPAPLEAARLAARRGVRIYTVGLSSPNGPLAVSCQSSDPSGFGGEFEQDRAGPSRLDVETLKQIAALTGGQYFPASGLSGLKNVFQRTELQRILITEKIELSVVFVSLGVSFALLAILLSYIWNPLL